MKNFQLIAEINNTTVFYSTDDTSTIKNYIDDCMSKNAKFIKIFEKSELCEGYILTKSYFPKKEELPHRLIGFDRW